MTKNKNLITIIAVIVAIIAVNLAVQFYFFRLDLTSEKRYSVSKNTKELLRNLDSDISVVIYLDGDLNSGFLRLRKATAEMLSEFKVYAGNKLSYTFVNPSAAATDKERMAKYEALERKGLRATVVYDKDSEGKSIQKVIFPWAQVIRGRDTVNVQLLKNIQGNSGSENLNISIESLEFELTDAIRTLTRKEVQRIAFLEGHDELHEILTHDITEALSKYFQIDRGSLHNDPSVLDPYKAIIIAKPQSKFSESDKFIIDQYIMNGGRVLWLVDGTRISMDTLANYGFSPALQSELNLNDQLFRYGVRINPDLLLDVQSVYIPVDKAREGDRPDYQPAPWYFSPLLLTSPNHPISRNVTVVKSEFASSIDFVGNDPNIHKEVLLVTSQHSRAIPTPTHISLDVLNIPADPAFFNQRHLPVAVALEGIFPSVFNNRFPPQGVIPPKEIKAQSVPTRMIVIADGDIIRNDVSGIGVNARPQPLGYDSYMNQEFGNKSFIMNSILYLTDDDGWLKLRSRELTIRLLDKIKVNENKKAIQIINVALPVFLLIIFAILNTIIRKRKYSN